jgi:hypothetical protein
MPRELENTVRSHVLALTGSQELLTPDWLVRPGRAECGRLWPTVQQIYTTLTGAVLPDVMRSIERRTVDLVFHADRVGKRVLEVDEPQHFNEFRAITLTPYPPATVVAFPVDSWLRMCRAKRRLEGGGFAAPKPPLFPGVNGRHRQRAFRDALCDLLPSEHGYLPTLRIAWFEVADWIHLPVARERMRGVLAERGVS